jgi:hypothetical protein
LYDQYFFTFIRRFTLEGSIQHYSFSLKSQFCFPIVKQNCKYIVKSIWISWLLLPFHMIEHVHIVCVVCVSYCCHNHTQTTRHMPENYNVRSFLNSYLHSKSIKVVYWPWISTLFFTVAISFNHFKQNCLFLVHDWKYSCCFLAYSQCNNTIGIFWKPHLKRCFDFKTITIYNHTNKFGTMS